MENRGRGRGASLAPCIRMSAALNARLPDRGNGSPRFRGCFRTAAG